MKLFFITILLSIFHITNGQTTSAPIIDSVSVDPDGNVIIGWHDINSVPALFYVVSRLRYDINPDHPPSPPLDTIYFGEPLVYTDNQAEADKGVKAYRVNADDGVYSAIHKTMFLRSYYDSCNAAINLSWTRYEGWNGELDYKIYDFDTKAELGLVNDTVFVVNNIISERIYSFFIRAFNNEGKTSSSNVLYVNTDRPDVPLYISAGNVIANESSLDVEFLIDPGSQLLKYILYRSQDEKMEDKEQIEIYEDYNLDNINYSDINYSHEEVYYYQLVAIDACDLPVFYSDTLKNIVSDINYNNNIVELQWSDGNIWPDEIINYEIYRNNYENDQILITEVSTNRYNDIIDNLAGQGNKNEICYTIKAINTDNGNYNVSYIKCIEVIPEIFIPETFSPDNDGINDYFIPEFDFLPSNYKLTIIDRTGKIIFESNDPNEYWSAESALQGTYVYTLTYKSNKRKYIKTGYINLVRKNNSQ